MKNYKLDEIAKNILILVGQLYIEKQIAVVLGLDKVIISQRTNTLQKYGYLIKERKGTIVELMLTQKGMFEVAKKARIGSNSLTSNDIINETYDPVIRIHNIQLGCDLLNKLKPREPSLFLTKTKFHYKPMCLNNHTEVSFQYRDKLNGMLTCDSLLLLKREVFGRYSELLMQFCDILNDMQSDFEKLESELGIKLKRNKNILCFRILKMEVAFTDNPLAKSINNDKNW